MTLPRTGVISTSRIGRELQVMAEKYMATLGHQLTAWADYYQEHSDWVLRCKECGSYAEIQHLATTPGFHGRWTLELPERALGSICTPFTEVCRCKVDRRALGGGVKRVYLDEAEAAAALPAPPD